MVPLHRPQQNHHLFFKVWIPGIRFKKTWIKCFLFSTIKKQSGKDGWQNKPIKLLHILETLWTWRSLVFNALKIKTKRDVLFDCKRTILQVPTNWTKFSSTEKVFLNFRNTYSFHSWSSSSSSCVFWTFHTKNHRQHRKRKKKNFKKKFCGSIQGLFKVTWLKG